MTTSHWATAYKKTFEYIRSDEHEFQNYLYVNYGVFSKHTTAVQEEKLFIKIRKGQKKPNKYFGLLLKESQAMFPCYARAATIPFKVKTYNYPYADSFWIYPVTYSWMLIRYHENRFTLVDWIDFQLQNDNLVSLDLFNEFVSRSITDMTHVQNELYKNKEYLAENPRLVNYFRFSVIQYWNELDTGVGLINVFLSECNLNT